jgi:hypothetical protein
MTGSAGGNDGPLINATTTKLAELIEKNSTSDQIIYASDPSLGNLMTSLTGRASTTGMFHEVASPGRSSASDASLIIVSAQGGQGAMQGGGPGAASVDTSKYKLVGKVGNYTLYRNTSATSKAGSPGTVIPWFVVFSILGLAIAGIAIDWFRPRHPGSTPPARTSHPGEGGSGTPGIVNAPGAYERKSVISIVPCFNEEGSIASVVAELRASAPDLDILVVDDGSTDRSAEIAAVTGVTVLSHGRNLGIGASLRTGMLYALDRGYRFAVQVDGDGQHDPSFTPAMMSVLESGEADVVISSRFLGTEGYKPPFLRRVGTRVLARAVKLATGVRATDTTSGFRAMNRRALSFLVDNYPEDYPESESLVLMRLGGIRWKEIPVAMRERRLGTSSVKGLVSVAYVAKVLGRITLDAVRFKAPRDPVYARVSP